MVREQNLWHGSGSYKISVQPGRETGVLFHKWSALLCVFSTE